VAAGVRQDPRIGGHPTHPTATQAAFTAARDIEAGEPLTITYTDSSQGVAQRREHLLHAYGFECRCALCVEQAGGGGGG
jgi:hypothetical protein